MFVLPQMLGKVASFAWGMFLSVWFASLQGSGAGRSPVGGLPPPVPISSGLTPQKRNSAELLDQIQEDSAQHDPGGLPPPHPATAGTWVRLPGLISLCRDMSLTVALTSCRVLGWLSIDAETPCPTHSTTQSLPPIRFSVLSQTVDTEPLLRKAVQTLWRLRKLTNSGWAVHLGQVVTSPPSAHVYISLPWLLLLTHSTPRQEMTSNTMYHSQHQGHEKFTPVAVTGAPHLNACLWSIQ